MWRRQWEQVIPFFAYPPDVRKMIYTTNAIESLHMQLRKIVKNRGAFPTDQAAKKLRFLALRNIEKNWKMPPVIWKQEANPFAILFGKRFKTLDLHDATIVRSPVFVMPRLIGNTTWYSCPFHPVRRNFYWLYTGSCLAHGFSR